jgi:hypothetical protein
METAPSWRRFRFWAVVFVTSKRHWGYKKGAELRHQTKPEESSMRRLLLASCIALLPGLALAQSDNSPPAAPPDAGMGGPMGGPGMGGSGMGGWGDKHGHRFMDQGAFLMKYYAANTTHDGHLTLAQAKTAGLQPVVDHFTDIDVNKHGYVTFYDIQAWQLDDMAKRLEKRADELRAQD